MCVLVCSLGVASDKCIFFDAIVVTCWEEILGVFTYFFSFEGCICCSDITNVGVGLDRICVLCSVALVFSLI